MKIWNRSTFTGIAMFTLIATLGSGSSSSPARAATPSECEVVLANGTEIRARLLETVSSSSAQERQPLLLEVVEAVKVDGQVVVAQGARVEGTIVRAQPRHGFGRRGKLAFSIDRALAIDGEMLPLANQTSFRGNDRYSKAAVVTLLVGPFGIFVKGGDIELPAGTELSAFVRGDRMVRLANVDCSTNVQAGLGGQARRTAL